jgi:SAM-dependent methyltransferase
MSVSEEEVVWCYRLLLGREPESRQVVLEHMDCESRASLIRVFLGSAEFGGIAAVSAPRMPLDIENLEIEVQATEQQLAALVAKIRSAWSHLGLERPHFSVVTDPRFLPEHLDASIQQFWASGETEAQRLEHVLERYRFGRLALKTCVEYGCGVGRVTPALAQRFARVHAYDISPAHLALAREHTAESGVGSVEFHLCSETFLQPLVPCDFFYSCIVLQHNPPPVIMRLLENALAALKPSGVAVFQVPSYIAGYRFELDEYLRSEAALDMEMHCLPQKFVFEVAARQRCTILEVREDDCTGAPSLIISNTFIIRKA